MIPTRLSIQNLFGRDKAIDIDLSDRVRILYGKNGCGKTTILRIINSILSGSLYELRPIKFSKIILTFDGNQKITIEKEYEKTFAEKIRSKLVRSKREYNELLDMKVKFWESSREIHSDVIKHDIEIAENFPLHYIDQEIPELSRVGPREWQNLYTGEVLSLGDIAYLYSDKIPWFKTFGQFEWYKKVISNITVKFIQTQRLLTIDNQRFESRNSKQAKYENTVISYSNKLKLLIKDCLAESVAVSQKLDSSYLKRLLSYGQGSEYSDDKIIKLSEQAGSLGKELEGIGLLENLESNDIDPKSVEKTDKKAIYLYFQDTVKKYQVFDNMKNKISLFQNIINKKFSQRKVLTISKTDGIRVSTPDGDVIPPRLLSSGEQHEIVLLFDLIFQTKNESNSFVMIDEPEISLHIDWQETFLNEIEEIGKLSNSRFLIATHSPVIIGDKLNIAREIE